MDEPRQTRSRRGEDSAAISAAYEMHADGLYDYCRWLADDPAAAENAVHAALIAALARPGLLADRTRRRAWLYTAARNECLRVRRPADESTTPDDTGSELLSDVRAAAAALPRDEQEVAELAFRHRLGAPEVAVVTGQPVRAARKAIAQAQASLAAAYGPDAAQAYVSAMATAPEPLYGRVVASAKLPDRLAYFAERAGPYRRAGYPLPLDRPESHRRFYVGAGVAAGLILLLTAGLAIGQLRTSSGGTVVPRPSVALSSLDPEPVEGGGQSTASPTGSPSASPSASPTASPTPSQRPSSSRAARSTPLAAPRRTPTVSITVRGLSGCVSGTYSMRVVITASGATGQSAEATWWAEGFPQTSFAATATEPNTYEVRLSGIPGNRVINVVGSVTSTGGKRGFSGVSQVSRSCGGRR